MFPRIMGYSEIFRNVPNIGVRTPQLLESFMNIRKIVGLPEKFRELLEKTGKLQGSFEILKLIP